MSAGCAGGRLSLCCVEETRCHVRRLGCVVRPNDRSAVSPMPQRVTGATLDGYVSQSEVEEEGGHDDFHSYATSGGAGGHGTAVGGSCCRRGASYTARRPGEGLPHRQARVPGVAWDRPTIADGEMVAIVGLSGSGVVDDHEHDHRRSTDLWLAGHRRVMLHRPASARRRLPREGGHDVGVAFQPCRVAADADGRWKTRCCRWTSRARLRTRAARSGAAQPRARRARGRSSTTCRPSCPAASSSASRSRARWPPTRQLVIGDEPTGNLDTETAARDVRAARRAERARARPSLYVTHDPRARRARAARVILIRDGRVVDGVRRDDVSPRSLHKSMDRPDATAGARSFFAVLDAGDRGRERRHLRGPAADGSGDEPRGARDQARTTCSCRCPP